MSFFILLVDIRNPELAGADVVSFVNLGNGETVRGNPVTIDAKGLERAHAEGPPRGLGGL